MASVDSVVFFSSVAGLILFFAAHVGFLRFGQWPSTFKAMLFSVVVGWTTQEVLFGFFWIYGLAKKSYSVWAMLFFSGLSSGLYGLLVFHYIAWIFGMGEAAIRIRLLDELDRMPGGSANLDEIYERYNAEMIFRTRLSRLVNAGHLAYDGSAYRIRSRVLFVQSAISNGLKRLLGDNSR